MSAASEINGFNCKMEDEDIFYSDEEFSDTEDSEMRYSEVNGNHITPSEDPTSKTVYFQFFSSSEITEEGGKVVSKEMYSEAINKKDIPLVNRVLPPEMLEKILGYLAPKDLNNVVLVCKTWKNMGEAPALWSWFKIKKSCQLKMKRFQGCQEIIIGNAWSRFSWGCLGQEILEHPGLKKIRITLFNSEIWGRMHLYDDWFRIEGDLISKAFAKMEEIEIYKLGSSWPKAQANVKAFTKCVFDAIVNRPNNLKRLVLDKVSYKDGVDSLRLVTALNNIRILKLNLYKEDDVNLLFKTMMQKKTSVTSLSLLGNLVLSELEPEYLFGTFDKLKEFGIRACDADHPPLNHLRKPDMLKTLCEKIADGTNLKTLRLEGFHDFSHMSRGTLSRMVIQLEELELSSQYRSPAFSSNDLTTIVTAIANETSNLRRLNISTDLRLVSSRLVAKMATQVEELELGSLKKEEQVKVLFGVIADRWGDRWSGPGKLKRMTLRNCSHLGNIEVDTLASAVNNLESFELDCDSYLSVREIERIFQVTKKRTALKRLSIWVYGYVSYAYPSFLPLVADAAKIIPELYIQKVPYYDYNYGSRYALESDSDSDQDLYEEFY